MSIFQPFAALRAPVPATLSGCQGLSGLFESWRVIQVGALTWFYDGPGGNFRYVAAERLRFNALSLNTFEWIQARFPMIVGRLIFGRPWSAGF